MFRRTRLWSVQAVIFGVIFFYALRLSAGDRGTVDFVVLSLVALAFFHALFRLIRRMMPTVDDPLLVVWHVVLSLVLWTNAIVGRAEAQATGGWLLGLNYALLVAAIVDTLLTIRREAKLLRADLSDASTTPPDRSS